MGGHQAAVAFLDALRTSLPTGDDLATIVNTHSHPIAESDRLFLRGFLRFLQKTIEHADALQKEIPS